MCAKITDLASYAEKMGVSHNDEKERTVTLTREEIDFLIAQIDEELGRNKSVLQRKCSTNIKPKTRERFQRQWVLMTELKKKLT